MFHGMKQIFFLELKFQSRRLEVMRCYFFTMFRLNHPVKKFKPDTKESRKKGYLGDLYSTHQPNRAPTPPPQAVKLQVKTEPCMTTSTEQSELCQQNMSSSGVKRSDPYEFDDDMAAPNVSMEGFKRNNVKVRSSPSFLPSPFPAFLPFCLLTKTSLTPPCYILHWWIIWLGRVESHKKKYWKISIILYLWDSTSSD